MPVDVSVSRWGKGLFWFVKRITVQRQEKGDDWELIEIKMISISSSSNINILISCSSSCKSSGSSVLIVL